MSKYDSRDGWKLVDRGTGEEIEVGAIRDTGRGEMVEVTYLQPPHKCSSQGKVCVKTVNSEQTSQYYASVVGGRFVHEEDAP